MLFLLWIVVLGFAFFLVETLIPMSEPFKLLVRVIAILVAIGLLASFLGLDFSRSLSFPRGPLTR